MRTILGREVKNQEWEGEVFGIQSHCDARSRLMAAALNHQTVLIQSEQENLAEDMLI